MDSIATPLMPIARLIDPVPVACSAPTTDDPRVWLVGLPKGEIAAALAAAGLDAKAAKLRAKQIWPWIYHRGVTDFETMTDIAKAMRPWLGERFTIDRPRTVTAQQSNDGTRKWLLATADGHEFEMVFIPDADRGTLCISSQVGCTLNCRFCHTGTCLLYTSPSPRD